MDSLFRSSMTLSFTTSRRFIPTLSRPKAHPNRPQNPMVCPTLLEDADGAVGGAEVEERAAAADGGIDVVLGDFAAQAHFKIGVDAAVVCGGGEARVDFAGQVQRSEEHTSEL